MNYELERLINLLKNTELRHGKLEIQNLASDSNILKRIPLRYSNNWTWVGHSIICSAGGNGEAENRKIHLYLSDSFTYQLQMDVQWSFDN